MKLMTCVENLTLEEWNAELKDETISKNDPSSAASETLAKIA